MSAIDDLRTYLDGLKPGDVQDAGQLSQLLSEAWPDFSGSDEESTWPSKIVGRMEEVKWTPPVLKFAIERHGGTAMGSTRASLHDWTIDVEQRTALMENTRYRQLQRRNPPLHVKPLAKDIADLIINGRNHPALQWSDNRREVYLQVGEVIPADCPAQTLTGRRKRFKDELIRCLASAGWHQLSGRRPHTYGR